MDIKDILTERASSILYHGTNKDKAYSILRRKFFEFSNKQKQYRKSEKFPYFLSTARSPQSRFFRSNFFSTEVIFVLNGEWVNRQNYLISFPIEIDNLSSLGYYKNEEDNNFDNNFFRNPYDSNVLKKMKNNTGRNIKYYHTTDIFGNKNTHIEGMMEDRIWSKNSNVTINGFIKEIHLLKQNISFRSVEKSIIAKAKELGIPTWYYKDSNSYGILNKNNANQVN